MKKITVLSENERQFADEHHDTVLHFLSHFHLKMADYYDVVIFGYLSAVQSYLADPELQKYRFSTIAWSRMMDALAEEQIYQRRPKRCAATLSYEKDTSLNELNRLLPDREKAIEDQLFDREILYELLSYSTPKEREVLYLKADGYSYHEISEYCSISVAGVQNRISRFRNRLMSPRIHKAAI